MTQRIGNLLFKFRRFFYLIPIVLSLTSCRGFAVIFPLDLPGEIFDVFCFLFVLCGLWIRVVASGTSMRLFKTRESKRFLRLKGASFTGIFSLWRHPHFIGDLFIVTGLALLSQSFRVLGVSILIFLFCYIPILAQKETMARKKLGPTYETYRKKTGLLFPSLLNWKKPTLRFRVTAALHKENGVLLYAIFLFVFLEGLEDSIAARHLYLNYHWLALAFLALMIWHLHRLRTLPSEEINSQEWPE